MIHIAVDAMSGDEGPCVAVDAAVTSLTHHADLVIDLVGQTEVLEPLVNQARISDDIRNRLNVQEASEIVSMSESPSASLRQKKDSSMRVAINRVQAGDDQACVSAGNTGALMATARFVCKTLDDIDRPAILAPIPSRRGGTLMLDLGASTECTPEQLFQYAVMGAVVARAVYGLESPRVGLLNIGAEDIKGNPQVQQAGSLLNDSELNYIGFVEGDDIYIGEVDVVVCDGFIGNVALKTSEGLGKLMAEYLRAEFSKSWATRIAGLCAMSVLKRFRRRVDPRQYNGATLAGLQGTVVKSHGDADAVAFASAISVARTEVVEGVPSRIRSLLAENLGEP
ncbi:phosphate acyltransferase PlsX [Salinisphaera sp. USBA-960]|uniref:phosphate acyltransferase PlsX n=1 Tax=Salinisphaera orenii TaxID=856731 RepID=UPI000DBEA063|nr:phosphate acyltransferase PlsX [Salifodinibacter halophilus]NNC25915.1 phosphate acyltransferase PlsX [Salifodinibacter halophilus]